MRSLALLALGVGVLAGVAALAAAARWTPPVPQSIATPGPTVDAGLSHDSVGSDWAPRAPFRRGRHLPRLRFAARRPQAPVPEQASAVARPALQLHGIILGAEPSGIVEGLPGVDGARAVRVGDTVGGLRVARITATMVEVRASDTTWILRVRGGSSAAQ